MKTNYLNSMFRLTLTFIMLFTATTMSYGQIAQRGSATTANRNSGDLTINKPNGVVAGDVLIVNIVQTDQDGNSLDDASLSGWTEIEGNYIHTSNNGNNRWRGTVLYKIAGSSEPSSYTFNIDNDANSSIGSIIAFSGVDVSGSTLDIIKNVNSGNGNSISVNSITTTTDNSALIMLTQLNDNKTHNNWGYSLSELYDDNTSSGRDATVAAAWKIVNTAGQTEDGSVDLSGNERWIAIYIALKPITCTDTDAVTLPWNEGFEDNDGTYTTSNSNVGNCWEYQEDNVGRLRFDQVSHTGSKAALLDVDYYDNNNGTQNHLIKTINLSDYTTATDLELSFWFFDGDDEDNNGDAVWIRGNNTADWIKIYDILPKNFDDREWNQITNLDIDAVLANAGQVVSSTFQIRLGQYDNYFYATSGDSSDGIAFDDIEITGTITIPCDSNQTLLMEKFDGIEGTFVSDLTSNSNYPNNPSSTSQLTSFEIETNTDDNYGVRVRGNIVAPQTGDYIFWIAGDDNVELWLSTDNNASNRVKIAYHNLWTNPQQWDKYSTQKSASIALIEGETYYIEALMKEGGGLDNLAVGWAKPGQSTSQPSEVIPCSVLAPFVPCVAPITYAVTGSNLEYCTGDTDTTAIGLNNSQTGITYQLLRDDTNVGDAEAGTGSAIDFGDFSNAGNYTVVATRTDGGCTQTMTGEVVITENTPAEAVFTANNTTIEVGESITFTNNSTNAVSYTWNFGDGSPVSDQTNPTHTFNTAGTFTVTLTATNSCGSDIETKVDYITVTNPPVDLFYEDFQDENQGDISGIDDVNQIAWYTNPNNSNPVEFAVDEDGSVHHFEADRTNNEEADWYTDPINISGYDNLKLSLFVREGASSGDIIKLRYSLDNGTTKISVNSSSSTISGGSGDDTAYEFSFTDDLTAEDNLQIYITFITSSDQFKIDDVKLTGTLDCDAVDNNVTGASATTDDSQATLTWANPNATCVSIDEVLVVAKQGSAVTTSPSGDGSAYTASATFGSGTPFDGGYVVYKGTAETVSITGLTNGTTYHLTTFTREGTTWSSGVTVTVTPIESPYLFFEDFEDEADEAITGTDVNGIGWSATLNGQANYFGVDTQSGNKLFRVDDLDNNEEGIKWESNTINIAGKTDLELSAYLEFDGTENTDYLRVKVLIDEFIFPFTPTVASFDGDVDDQDGNKSWLLVDASGNPITGNTLKIIIEFFHDSNEEYLVDNIRLTDGNYWLGNENDVFTNTEKWSYKEVPTSTSNVKIANGAHLKLFDNRDVTVKNFTVDGELTIEKDASLTTTENFENTDTGTTILNSGHDEFSSLLVQGEASGSISYNRWVNNFEAGTNGNDVIASPVTGESWSSVMANNQSSIFNNGTYWSFTPYINGGTGWGNLFTSSTDTTIESGLGYRVASPAGNSQTVKFTGELVNGDVTVQLSRNQSRWNVVGNPYATYIDLAAFIQANTAVLDEGYVLVLGYNGVNNTDGWAYYNLATATANNVTIAPGQGFYLAAKTDNVTVTFTPSMKTVSGADDFLQDGARSAVLDMQKLRLNINNGNKARHAEFYFFNRDDVSESFDLGYDALIKNDGDNFNLYSTPLDGTVNKLAIQTSHLDNMETSIIPVGVEAQAGQQLTFSIDNLNIADNIIIWLEDRATGVWTEMNDGSTYILNTTETISGTGRFYIHFENGDTLNIKEVETNQINIVSISGNKTIVVNGNLETDSILELYDINGRKVLTKNLERYTTTHRIDARHLPTAAYIVSIRNHTQKVSKQIIIN